MSYNIEKIGICFYAQMVFPVIIHENCLRFLCPFQEELSQKKARLEKLSQKKSRLKGVRLNGQSYFCAIRWQNS
jgi:hypothetical protein